MMNMNEMVERLAEKSPSKADLSYLAMLKYDTAAEFWERSDSAIDMLHVIAATLPRSVLLGLACDFAEHALPVAESFLRSVGHSCADAPRAAIAAVRDGTLTPEIKDAAVRAMYLERPLDPEVDTHEQACAISAVGTIFDALEHEDDQKHFESMMTLVVVMACGAAGVHSEEQWQIAHVREVVPWSMVEEAMR